MLARARLESDEIGRAAMSDAAAKRAQIEQIVQEAREKGYREGLEKGREEAVESVRRDLESLVERYSGLLEALAEERVRNLREQELEIISLCVSIAERIVREHIQLDPETVARIASAALERATERDEVVLLVHPDDIAVLETYVPDFRDRYKTLKKVRIQEDARISRGGCMLETGAGYVDGTLERQYSEMRRELGLDEQT
jgi:flagellar assembly protein FliH